MTVAMRRALVGCVGALVLAATPAAHAIPVSGGAVLWGFEGTVTEMSFGLGYPMEPWCCDPDVDVGSTVSGTLWFGPMPPGYPGVAAAITIVANDGGAVLSADGRGARADDSAVTAGGLYATGFVPTGPLSDFMNRDVGFGDWVLQLVDDQGTAFADSLPNPRGALLPPDDPPPIEEFEVATLHLLPLFGNPCSAAPETCSSQLYYPYPDLIPGSVTIRIDRFTVPTVPEPNVVSLAAFALSALLGLRTARRR